MQFRTFASISGLVGLALISTVSAAIDPVSLAVIVIAGLAIAKEKLIIAEIHRNYIKKPSGGSYGAPSSGYGAPSSDYSAPSSGYSAPRSSPFGLRRRGKREVNEDAFESLFETAKELDTDDCAKLMVCHVFEKSNDKLNAFEKKVNGLFANNGAKVDLTSAKAEYQLAAYIGGLKQAGLCQQRYPKCLANPESLTKL